MPLNVKGAYTRSKVTMTSTLTAVIRLVSYYTKFTKTAGFSYNSNVTAVSSVPEDPA